MITSIISKLTRRSRIMTIGIAMTTGIAAAWLGMGASVDARLQDIRDEVMGKNASQSTVIVAIDQPSINEIHAWPWPRSVHARMVDRLVADGARRIVFDVAFTSPAQDPVQDAVLEHALARSKGRVSLLALNDVNLGHKADTLPIERLRRYATAASGWISIDNADRISLPYGQMVSNEALPTLSAQLGESSKARDMDKYQIDWSIKGDTIPVVSYADVLNGRAAKGILRGKDVIIGITAQAMGDRWMGPNTTMIPGVLIHAMGAETLKRQPQIPVGPLIPLAIACTMITLCMALRNRPLTGAMLGISSIGLVVISWLVQERFGYQSTMSAGLIAMLAAGAVQGAAAVAGSVMRRLTTDAATDLPNLTAMEIDEPAGSTVAVRLHNHLDTANVLGGEAQADLLRRIRDRIRLVAGDNRIYQVDEHSFAWRTALEPADLTNAVEGLGALFGAGILIGNKTIETPISAGIVEDEADVTKAVKAALLAAEHAARQGLPWTRHVDAHDDAEWRLTMMGELEKAMKDGDVWIAYQPKWNAETGACIGSEALVRWTHPTRGPIRPDQFIPLLEESSKIEGLTAHVLESAVRDIAPLKGIGVAVNLSTRMLGKGRVVEMVKGALERHDMLAERLTLEITESAMLAGDDSIAELQQLSDMGITISIDDYGTGQSTLTYLRRLPAKELKIDQTFVRAMLTSRSDHLMIDSTIALSHQLGLKVVAEGVETAEEMEALKGLACDTLQGYHLGRPMALRDFIAHTADVTTGGKRKAA